MRTVVGKLDAGGLRFAIVLPRFNEVFGQRLLSAAVDCLVRHGAAEKDLTLIRVPGCFEVPAAVRAAKEAGQTDAVIALGVLIRGATTHYDHIAAEVSKGVGDAARAPGAAVVYGIVTAESQEQALERCGGKAGNRGWDAALAAIEMANLQTELAGGNRGAPEIALMGRRRSARELALQLLFQVEITRDDPVEVTARFWAERQVAPSVREFAERLSLGTLGKLAEIDALIAGCADNWRLERMAIVDRNVLRMAIHELLYIQDTPGIVVINEAIEVAKKYGSEDSSSFINGILDSIRRDVEMAKKGT